MKLTYRDALVELQKQSINLLEGRIAKGHTICIGCFYMRPGGCHPDNRPSRESECPTYQVAQLMGEAEHTCGVDYKERPETLVECIDIIDGMLGR